MSPHAKNCKNRPSTCPGTKMKYHVQRFIIIFKFFWFLFLAKLWRTHFWGYRHRFCTKWHVSAGLGLGLAILAKLAHSELTQLSTYYLMINDC